MATASLQPKVGIIVSGMHRSGTSATTRIINLLGADVAPDLMPAMAENAKGFWESRAVARIHDELLDRLGSSWDDLKPLPERWIETVHANQARGDLAREITSAFSDSPLFVAKDPRLSRLLPLWLTIFEDLALSPVVVIVFRNPLEVAHSLLKRNQFPVPKSLLLYVRHYLELERASRDVRRIFVPYDRLLSDWRPLSQKLRDVLGPQLPQVSEESVAEIKVFLDRDLHHNRCTDEELAATSGIESPVVEMYGHLRTASEAGDESSMWRALDRLAHTLGIATGLFQGLLAAEAEEVRVVTELMLAERRRAMELAAALDARSAEAEQQQREVAAWRDRAARAEDALAGHTADPNGIRQSS